MTNFDKNNQRFHQTLFKQSNCDIIYKPFDAQRAVVLMTSFNMTSAFSSCKNYKAVLIS